MIWPMLRAGLLLGVFGVAGVSLVAMSFQGTRERIAANERAALLGALDEVLSHHSVETASVDEPFYVNDAELLGTDEPVPVYRVRLDRETVAVVLRAVAPDGYSGRIELLVGVDPGGRVTGVRVLSHRETPGLGDAIDVRRSDWILAFAGRSLVDPPPSAWTVERDGGAFDQFTGATITPRAVVRAVARSLSYMRENRRMLFDLDETPVKPSAEP